jgi:hypothetical protein
MWMDDQRHAPAALPPIKTRYPLYRRLVGPQVRSGQVRKLSPLSGFDLRTVLPRNETLYRLRYPGARFPGCLHIYRSKVVSIVKRKIFLTLIEGTPARNNGIRLQLKCDGTLWRTRGEGKGKLANGVDIQYSSHYLGTWCIHHYYRWYAHPDCQ